MESFEEEKISTASSFILSLYCLFKISSFSLNQMSSVLPVYSKTKVSFILEVDITHLQVIITNLTLNVLMFTLLLDIKLALVQTLTAEIKKIPFTYI